MAREGADYKKGEYSVQLRIIPWAVFLVCTACDAQPTLKQVLSWLPDDTETVIGANGPFPIPDFDTPNADDSVRGELSIAEAELRMRSFALGLFGLKNGGIQKSLKGKAVQMAVQGSRHFRPPAALGEMLYEGCEIIVFGQRLFLMSTLS